MKRTINLDCGQVHSYADVCHEGGHDIEVEMSPEEETIRSLIGVVEGPVGRFKSVVALAMDYYNARPLPWHRWSQRPAGTKLEEETNELKDALEEFNEYEVAIEIDPDKYAELLSRIEEEVADVAITLAWIAYCHGINIEDAIVKKTIKDRGRSVKDDITT